MDTSEMVTAKQKLCGSITMMLNGFESMTGLQITGVKIKRSKDSPMIESISLKVEIPE